MFIQTYAASYKFFLKRIFTWLITGILLIFLYACDQQEADSSKHRILVFTKTTGFRHESIPAGIKAIMKLGEENGFQVDTTENAARFTEENLKKYNAVVFLSTTQDVLNHVQQADFERYIQAGGGFVGIHAAADTEYNWPWYNKLVGAYF
jgi:cytochrome c